MLLEVVCLSVSLPLSICLTVHNYITEILLRFWALQIAVYVFGAKHT